MAQTILILGANGFIGSHLIEAILEDRPTWEVWGLDLSDFNLQTCLQNPRLRFQKGDMLQEKAWLEKAMEACDVVLPLAAIANPALYVQDPLRVYELDFEANLPIVRQCVAQKKRLVFPSTSEVYGMGVDTVFDEDTSPLTLGPICKQRWIYACAKQMMDRLIFAYGQRDGLDYTLFRPFNWIGPRLDSLDPAKRKQARVVTQFLGNILDGAPITLVDGGSQRRAFTDVRDGIEALLYILDNPSGKASQQIFNIGNPANDVSIGELAETLLQTVLAHPQCPGQARQTRFEVQDAISYLGEHYQDTQLRVPSVQKALDRLNWKPRRSLQDSLSWIVDMHFSG
ncbi:MAG: bifunctional UDP-4-keto-pentose/UDP-xylose synthase [Alphaproteobacteria bacterium]